MQTTQHTVLVTQYINAHTQWRNTLAQALRDNSAMERAREWDAEMWRLVSRFTAAHWQELHARRV